MSVIKNSVIIFLCLVFAGLQAYAQTNEERRERADKLFEKEQYVEATKDYLHLLSLEPRSADLNFRYGACLLFNSNKKNESIRYLSFAVTEPNIDSRAFYFHGLALHLNYQFAEAQRSYGTYVNLNIGKTDKRYPADRQIEMCNNGKRLLTTFTDIIVAEKQEIDSDKFFRIYTDANTIGGDILVTAKFQSKMDLKMGHVPIVHFPPNANAIYYSSYGESLANGKDIYVRRRLPSGDWGEPQILPGMVNSRFDEDFPYMHPSGNYLYFSSTGHNSMGGYDVYMSRFDPNTNSFREPENVDFAISSPDDDFFYVVDSLFQNAYFASARQSQDRMLHVYKVKVARVPLKEVIIMGEFISEVDPEMKALEINLTYHSNSKDVGLVKSNKVGKYSYVFPQGGKYNYTVSVAGLNEDFQFVVDLPFLDELRPLKQKIIHTKEDGKDVLKILNLFDEDVEGAEAIIADVIRKKAELNVNIDQFDVDEVEAEIRKKEVLAELGFNNMRPEEIAQKLEELSTINSDKSKVIDQMENNLAAEIVAKSERIQTLQVVQNELTEQAMKTSDPLAKHNLLSEAQRKEAEKQTLIASVQGLVQLKEEALTVLKSNDNVSSGKQLAELKKSYEGLIRSEEDAAAIELLSDNKTLILSASKGTPEDLLGIYVDKATDLRERIKAEGKKEQEINKTIDAANQELNKLQGSLELAKKKDRPTIERQIADKQDEIKMAGSDLQRAGEKKRAMAKELAIVEEQIASLQSAMNADEIVAVRNDDVERSVKAVKAISEIPSKIDYQTELANIEEESPALFNNGDLTVYDEIRTELNKDKAAVSKDSKLSNAERTAKELALVEEAIDKLEERTNEIVEELKSNPSDAQLLAEQQKTLGYVKQLKLEEKQLNQELLAIRTENPDLAYSKVDVLREIDPSFETEIATIRNSGDDELLTVTKELERTTELIEKLKVDLGETKKAFELNPGDPELEAKFALLNELLTDYQKTTKGLSNQKEELEAERALKPLDPDVLYAGFNEQLTSITAAQLSPEDRLAEEKTLQNSLLERISEEDKKVQKELRKNPEDDALKTKVAQIDLLKTETNARIAEIEAELSREVVAETDYSSEDTYLKDYANRLNAISTAGENKEEELAQRIALNTELLKAVEQALTDKNSELSASPNDERLLSELAKIEGFKEGLDKRIEQDQQVLNELTKPVQVVFANKDEVRKVVLPEYNERRAEIQNDEVLNEIERRAQIVKLNNTAIAELNDVLKEVDQSLTENPTDPQLMKSKTLLENYVKELQAENKLLSPGIEIEKTDVLAELLSESDTKRSEVSRNNALSSDERTLQLIQVEEELQAKLSQELERVETKLNRTPDDVELLEAKRELISAEAKSSEEVEQLKASLPLVLQSFDSKEELLQLLAGSDTERISKTALEASNPKEKVKIAEILSELSNKLSELEVELNQSEILSENEKETKRESIEALRTELTSKQAQIEAIETVEVAEIDPNEIRKNYSKDKEAINNSTDNSTSDRLNELNELDRELIANAQKELAQIDKKQKKDPENPQLLERESALSNQVVAAETRIAENEQLIAVEKTKTSDPASDEKYLSSVYADYEKLVEARSTNADSDKLLELENELLAALLARESELEKNQPESEELKRLENLIEVQQEIVESTKTTKPTSDEQYLSSVYADYEKLLEARASNANSDKLLELENELLTALLARESELEKNQPESEELKRLENLIEVQQEIIENAFSQRFDALSPEQKDNLNNEVLSNYTKRRNEAVGDEKTLSELEGELQNAISKRLAAIEKEQKRKPSVSLDMEAFNLNRLVEESKVRQSELNEPSTDDKQIEFITAKRAENAIGFEMNEDLDGKSAEELKAQEALLAAYEAQLREELEAVELSLEQNQSEELQNQKEWLDAEIAVVEKVRRKFSVRIGELETTVEASEDTEEVRRIEAEIAALNLKLTEENLSPTERRELNNELRSRTVEKAEISNESLATAVKDSGEETVKSVEEALAVDSENETLKGLSALVSGQQDGSKRELERIEDIDDPLERAFELEQLKEAEAKRNNFVEEVLVDEQKAKLQEEEGVELFERSQLEEQKRRFIVRIGELTSEIEAKNKQVTSARKNEKVALEQEIASLEEELQFTKEQVVRVGERLSQLGDPIDDSSVASLAVTINFQEERDLASSETYKNYEPLGTIAFQKAEQIRNLEQEVGELKQQLDDVLYEEKKSGRKGSVQVGELIQTIREKNEEIDRLKIELIQDQYAAERLLPKNEEEAMKLRNLVTRGVKPIETAVLAVALLQLPTDGFAIGERIEAGESRKAPIAVGVEHPSGLVYRVQVGAFARPIQESLFSEFNPVSGEKIEGTNITRYMAGYFNNSTKVLSARDQIRQLGYSDAFIVAYCNGKRIQFGEARRLEAEGICVPKRENELMIEVAEKTAENLGIPLVPELEKVNEHDYNKAPGAAKADAIEDMTGLFYTVQIGVFNRPVGESNLYGMNEILTFRLPNGQIRYSSGMFDSFGDGVPRRTQALGNGVIGAFVTAYYNGERISIQEAKRLLEEKGESILQSRQQKKTEDPTIVQPEVKIDPALVEVVKPAVEEKMRVQVVTKKKFDTYPRDVLNRYNTEGIFYFDEEDGRVKSAIYPDEDHLPRLYNFRKDIDTLYIPVGLLSDENIEIMELDLAMESIPGDIMDWMLRYNKRRSLEKTKNGIVIRLMGIKAEEKEALKNLMNQMGYLPRFVSQNELELELNEK